MLELLTIAFKACVMGYVYSTILIQPDHILGPFYKWYKKFFISIKTIIEEKELPEEIARMKNQKTERITRIETKESKWLKPLGACELCTAGQLSLWLFLFHKLSLKYFSYYYSTFEEIINLIFIICLTILLTRILFLMITILSKK